MNMSMDVNLIVQWIWKDSILYNSIQLFDIINRVEILEIKDVIKEIKNDVQEL